MNPLILTMAYFMIFMGSTIVFISSHWLVTWIGFEMNLMAMIPLMLVNKTPRSTEAATKYFITQASASMIFMFAIILNFMLYSQWNMLMKLNPTSSLLLTMAMLMKLGMAPFHFWMPEVTQGVSLSTGMILLTWQKLAPLSIMYQILPSINYELIMTSAIMSILIGGWGGLNQLQLRKIMAYSSISNMGWMMAVLTYNPTLMILNLTVYIIITLTMFMYLNSYNITTTSMLSQLWNINTTFTIMMSLILLSLGGLPPLTGFIPKWLIIQEMTKNNNIILPTFMAMLTLINLLFYTRLIYSSSMTLFPSTSSSKLKWHYKTPKMNIMTPTLSTLSILLLPLSPMFIIFT
uniref:NADH-ubiquinone oxidoreductase chain 2 n=1 Tax=Echinosorex gymnura TaxID=162630 RepID=Q71MZ1_ECHGY|nr:NADH dehydrogenase subunit 2 [Echinosorex gymnura]